MRTAATTNAALIAIPAAHHGVKNNPNNTRDSPPPMTPAVDHHAWSVKNPTPAVLGWVVVAHGLLTILIWAPNPRTLNANAPMDTSHSWLFGDARALSSKGPARRA